MKTQLRHFLLGALLGSIIVALSFLFAYFGEKRKNGPKIEPITNVTDTLSVLDSTSIVEPETGQETKIVTVTVPMLVTDSTAIAQRDSILREYGILVAERDSLALELTRVQRYYRKDSVYEAWVSGTNPKLDSIKIFSNTRTLVMEVQTEKKVKPRFSFGVQTGGGVVFPINQKPTAGLYIGIGGQYNF